MLRALAGLPALAAALALIACGDEAPPVPDDPPAAFLERSLTENQVTSGRADISFEAASGPGAEPVGATLSGPFGATPGELPRFDLEGEAEAVGFGVDTELVSTGTDLFVVFFGETYRADPAQVSEGEQALASAQIEPQSWFVQPEYDGTVEVDGVDAVRITAGLDPAAVGDDLREVLGALGLEDLLGRVGTLGPGTIEALIGIEDETLRRVEVESPGALSLAVGVTDIGAEPEIEAPAGGAQPLSELLEELRSYGL